MNPKMFPTKNLVAIAGTGRSGRYWTGPEYMKREADDREAYIQAVSQEFPEILNELLEINQQTDSQGPVPQTLRTRISNLLRKKRNYPEVRNIINREVQNVTALLLAVFFGDIGVIRKLLEAGANPNQVILGGALAGLRPIDFLVENGTRMSDTAVVGLLLDFGADINRIFTHNGQRVTLLNLADSSDMRNLLRARGAMTAAELDAGTA